MIGSGHFHHLRAMLFALALSWAVPGQAVSVRFEPLEAVTAKAGAAILSEVLRVEHRRDNPQWRVLCIEPVAHEALVRASWQIR